MYFKDIETLVLLSFAMSSIFYSAYNSKFQFSELDDCEFPKMVKYRYFYPLLPFDQILKSFLMFHAGFG